MSHEVIKHLLERRDIRQAVSLLIGSKASAHNAIPVNLPFSEQNVLLKEGQGYLVRDKEALKIKVLQ